MLKVRTKSLPSDPAGNEILKFANNTALSPYVAVENIDSVNGVAIEWRESDDGNLWTTIVGTAVSIGPTNSNGQIITSNKKYLALHATGSAERLEISIVQIEKITGDVVDIR